MPSLPDQHILRLRRTDNNKAASEHLLVNVARTGRNDLDLRLIATDKEGLYETSIKESAVKSLQERNFTGNLDEWKVLLKFALFRRRPEGAIPDFLQGVEVVGAISGSTTTITIRKNIGGITQRLGTIPLKETEEEELANGLDWTEVATIDADALRTQVETLQASVGSQKDELAKLSTELNMLIKAKKDHENEMLSKFAALLNSKKLKIRDQQRMLQSGNIDVAAIGEVSPVKTPKAGASRKGKRKAHAASPVAASPESGEDGTDGADRASTQQHTPEPDEADAATETEDEDEEATKKSAASAVASQASTRGRSRRADRMEVGEDNEPPPRRNLPFSRRKAAKAPTSPAASTNHDEDDAETEDEL